MVIFPKALGHIDEEVADLFDRLGKQNTPVPVVLAETIRSLSACRRAGERRFIGCVQLLLNLREEDVMWKAHWLVPSEVIYRCGAVGYTPLLVLRQYRARQFIPATQGDHYKKRMREISEAWKKPFCMKTLTEGSTSTLEYKGWFSKRVNDNVPRPILGIARSLEESLRVIPLELEVMKQEFERKNSELEKRIEKLEEEKMCLSLDVDVQKMEVEKVKKEKRKVEEDRDDLKTHYKKAQASLDKIEEMKHHIGGLETALQDCELRIEQLEAREDQWKGELHHLQDQVGDRDYVMGEALVQIREVAEHLQELAIQARTLSMMYESSSDKGRELALLLDRVRTLGLREKVYL
ncbi:hypothetical protein V6Z11_A08G096200 [Gossypium hirsutum]